MMFMITKATPAQANSDSNVRLYKDEMLILENLLSAAASKTQSHVIASSLRRIAADINYLLEGKK